MSESQTTKGWTHWKPEWDDILRHAAVSAIGWKTVARQLGIAQSTVQRHAAQLGLRGGSAESHG